LAVHKCRREEDLGKVVAELQWFHKDVWSVGSAVEPSVAREISRGINVCMSGANQCRSRGVLFSAKSV
jgi:hypothetical protein